MGSISKSCTLILMFMLVMSTLSLLAVKPANAQATPTQSGLPTPSVPTFTVKLVGPATVVNTTYSLDPNTGKVVAQIGYTNEYSALEIKIKNQPFMPYYNASLGQDISLYYNVQYKLHNETDDWRSLYSISYFIPTQSNSDYTTLTISLYTGEGNPGWMLVPVGVTVDLQADAMIGYETRSDTFASEFLVAQTSGWSSTQTVTIPANIPLSPTPAPSSSTSTPTSSTSISTSGPSYASLLLITTITFVIIAFLLALIIALLLLMRHRKTSNLSNSKQWRKLKV